jgi:hypothetical protein
MAELMDRELLKRYHCAVVRSNRESLEKLKARMGSQWAGELRGKVGIKGEPREFCRSLEGFLRDDLRLCEKAEVAAGEEELAVSIKGCHICHANEELRREGSPTMCPVIPTGLQAISKVHGRKATLEGVDKPGPVGECTIKYRLK